MIRVCVSGACGKMGQDVIQALAETPELELVGAVDVVRVGASIGEIAGTSSTVLVTSDLEGTLKETKADVLVDFTGPKWVYNNCKIALSCGVSPVIGTTGLTREQVEEFQGICKEKKLGALWATNFAIGAILMMSFAKQAAAYFPDVEIIEYHHDQKLDAPSGTSLTTANLIREVREDHKQGNPGEKELVAGARGGSVGGIPIHSVRLPGFIAHQEVIFGDGAQLLTIKHDSMNRKCFMPGVMLACKKIIQEKTFVEGLDKLL